MPGPCETKFGLAIVLRTCWSRRDSKANLDPVRVSPAVPRRFGLIPILLVFAATSSVRLVTLDRALRSRGVDIPQLLGMRLHGRQSRTYRFS
jgi:hypothetical protein